MRLTHPNFMEKVTVVPGDLDEPNLGITDENMEQLKSVNIIFHGAADLIFDEHIKKSFARNVIATRDLIELAKKMPNIKSFVYISTTYIHGQLLLEEKFYDWELSFEEISLLLNNLSDSQATAITPLLTQSCHSVYSLTKIITETLIQNVVGIIPIGILRPSIVLNTNSEPLVAWLPSIQGGTGVIVGSAIGFLRVHRWKNHGTLHVIPADKVANSSIAAAWDISKRDFTEPPVYHSVPDKFSVPTWEKLYSSIEKGFYVTDLASDKQVWPYMRINVNNNLIYWILIMLLQILPGVFFDVLLKMQGKKPILMKIYRKAVPLIYTLNEYAVFQTHFFENERMKSVWTKMTDVDRIKFDFNMVDFDLSQYGFKILMGVKTYLFKEKMEDLPRARARLRRLEKLHFVLCKVFQISVAFVAYKLLYPTIQNYFSIY